MNTYYIGSMPATNELYHFGIKGQKWGIRRFQNPDGSYTEAGLKRYRKADARADLGYSRFQRLDNAQSGFVGRYKDDVKGYMKNTKARNVTRRESKKKDYEREAKAFLARSETTKAMNTYYNSLFKADKKSINQQYKSRLIESGKEAAYDYIDRELLRKKVMRDNQKDIWDRS